MPRRSLLKAIAAAGLVTPTVARAVEAAPADAADDAVTPEMIRRAEWLSGLEYTDDERELMLEGVNETLASFRRLREIDLDNSVAPAIQYDPDPHRTAAPTGKLEAPVEAEADRPDHEDDLAYATIPVLGSLLRQRKVSSRELTTMYLERLKRFDPVLECVISLTEKRALAQADAADHELASGTARSPLHGIPWGAKDLLAVPGYRTTWGAKPYEDQVLDGTATVVSRLDAAGAVLVAKLTLGALAWGDVWFGGTTKNPWKTDQGSSGSSAGSASATSAGAVPFAIGTETWGSIVSPCTRCGVSGLRPTFGRVSRHGAMALSWTMDKIGPIARTVDDCAWIFAAIHGTDGRDPTARDLPFEWPARRDPRTLRIGFVEELFEADREADEEEEEDAAKAREWKEIDRRTLGELEAAGFELIPVGLPPTYPVADLSFVLTAEATTAFDDLTRTGRDDLLVRQEKHAWPNVFRQGQLIPAVEYLRANRVRSLVRAETEAVFDRVDVYVCPSFQGDNLLRTNLTGHPSVVVPNGFRTSDGTPTSITFVGRLFGETDLLSVAAAYQDATDWHRRRPPAPVG